MIKSKLHFGSKTRKLQCFLSHCSDDHELVTGLNDILLSCFSKGKYDFFNTSAEERSTYAGDGRSDALRHALKESELMIAVITDSYLRSTICVSEISAFWFINKPVIPLVYSKNGIQFLKDLMGEDILSYVKTAFRPEIGVERSSSLGLVYRLMRKRRTRNGKEELDAYHILLRRCFVDKKRHANSQKQEVGEELCPDIAEVTLSNPTLILFSSRVGLFWYELEFRCEDPEQLIQFENAVKELNFRENKILFREAGLEDTVILPDNLEEAKRYANLRCIHFLPQG